MFGASPLVVWLKPYMVGEMLGIGVPERMMQQKPANYSTYAAHLDQVKENKERIAKLHEEKKFNKKKNRGPDRSRQFKMDVSHVGDISNVSKEGDISNVSKEGDISNTSAIDNTVSEEMEQQAVDNGNNVT